MNFEESKKHETSSMIVGEEKILTIITSNEINKYAV